MVLQIDSTQLAAIEVGRSKVNGTLEVLYSTRKGLLLATRSSDLDEVGELHQYPSDKVRTLTQAEAEKFCAAHNFPMLYGASDQMFAGRL